MTEPQFNTFNIQDMSSKQQGRCLFFKDAALQKVAAHMRDLNSAEFEARSILIKRHLIKPSDRTTLINNVLLDSGERVINMRVNGKVKMFTIPSS